MARPQKKPQTKGLVLADLPERAHLRDVQQRLSALRDDIAAFDLDIETLRDTLGAFESEYNGRLAAEHHILSRITNLTRHLERWSELLHRSQARMDAAQVPKKANRLERRRQNELGATPKKRAGPRVRDTGKVKKEPPAPAPAPEASRDRLKEAYRALARRFHPDLARTEEERLKHSAMMARINALYRAGDLERLRAMAEQAKGAELDDPELSIAEQTEILEARLLWFEAVKENLRDERLDLERSSTCQLMRQVRQAEAAGSDLVDDLKTELQARIGDAYDDVTAAVRLLEETVSDFNRKTNAQALTRRDTGLEKVFDPFADKMLVRLGLDQLNHGRLSAAAQRLAEWIEESASERPALVRLLLLTYVSELSPFPLEGIGSYDDIELRFAYLNDGEKEAPSLEQAIVELDDLVEYGVKRANEQVARLGLRFLSNDVREAVPAALQHLPVRRVFRAVLGVLSEIASCPGCENETFPVPLYRLRGLDNMRSSVCPECGHLLSSYWMPKGQDVQAVLNAAFLDYELISEWSFQLERSSIATQLVPFQVDNLTLGDLKRRLVEDVFTRYEIGIGRSHVQLVQEKKRVPERTPLVELDHQSFVIRFSDKAEISEGDALELVRHRIRNRFR